MVSVSAEAIKKFIIAKARNSYVQKIYFPVISVSLRPFIYWNTSPWLLRVHTPGNFSGALFLFLLMIYFVRPLGGINSKGNISI
jgi:hypothetical protein